MLPRRAVLALLAMGLVGCATMSPEEAARARELSSWSFEQAQQAQMLATQHSNEVMLLNAAAVQMNAAALLMTMPIAPPAVPATPTP